MFGCNNYNIGRLPRELQRAGAEVAALCHRGHSLSATRYLDWRFVLPERSEPFRTARRMVHLAVALSIFRPDIVIPGDERSLYIMIDLERRLRRLPQLLLCGAAKALRRSVPPRERIGAATRRDVNQRLAETLGVPCPAGSSPTSLAELETFVGDVGLPVVIKTNGSQAGEGVWICRTVEEVRRGWEERHRQTPGRRALVQKFVAGQTAMRSIAAIDGRVVAGLSMIKEQCFPARTGPSSLVRIISHAGMEETGDKMAQALGLTGMASLDFILGNDGTASLIEYNPRPTPVCHLGPLAASLVEALGGVCREAPPVIADGTRIALYPQEWVRQGGTIRIDADLLLDIPSDDPPLLERLTWALNRSVAALQARRPAS